MISLAYACNDIVTNVKKFRSFFGFRELSHISIKILLLALVIIKLKNYYMAYMSIIYYELIE